jgi:Kef-type K+ transport system membrane component KefB
MVSRGEVALVIAGAGLAGGLLDASTFSTLIVVTLATTLVTPPLLRLSAMTIHPAAWLSGLRARLALAAWQDYAVEE